MWKKVFVTISLVTAYLVALPTYAIDFTTFEFPPFTQKSPSGKATGPFKSMVSDVCKEMKEECEFSIFPTRRAKLKISYGQANAIFPFGWYRERAEEYYFSVPFMQTQYGFFVPESNKKKIDGLRDIQGFKVGVFGPSNTSVSLTEIRNLMIELGLNPIRIEVRTDESGNLIRMLERNRIDAYYSNKAVAEYRAKEFNVKGVRYAWTDKTLLYFVAFPKKTTDKSLVREFNQVALKLFSKPGYLAEKLEPWGISPPPLSKEVLDKYEILR